MVAWGRGALRRAGGIPKGYKETFESDGYIHYLGYGDAFTGIYRCQNIKLFKFVQFNVYRDTLINLVLKRI